jgi:hypothetical protein
MGRYIQLANDFLVLAEKELWAFIRAVLKLFGAEQARQSALHWIEELERMDWRSGESIPDWRWATVVASARLALWGPAIPIGVASFRSSIPTPPIPLFTLRRAPRDAQRKTRGRVDR